MRSRLLPLAILSALASAGCSSCLIGDELSGAVRKIAVDVCTEPNLSDKGGVKNCNVDFSTVNISERVTREITLSNISDQEILVQSATLSADSDPSFSVDHVPSAIKAGMSTKMMVSFGPMLDSAVEAKVILQTDAENATTPADGQVEIHLRGAGVDNGLPDLKVEVLDMEQDACCDLASVPTGSAANCRLRLTNTGTRGLVLEEVSLVVAETDGPWMPVGALPTDPADHTDDQQFTISPGGNATVTYRFAPTDLLPHRARVLLRTNAPRSCGPVGAFDTQQCNRRDYLSPCPAGQAGQVTVDLKGQGVDPPLCVARIKSVNGAAEFDPRQIEPLDNVELTAEESVANGPGATIVSTEWTITRKPPGSGARFNDATSVTPHFEFANTSTNIIPGLDVAGEYEAHCTVTDSRGVKSINESQATVAFAAVPSEAIHLQLVWDTPSTDVDLHLVRENPPGTFNAATPGNESDDDCYYANCKPTTTGPVWDTGHNAHEGGNPVLDVDDVEGYGPENSNIDAPIPGRYLARVHYYSDHGHGQSVATMRIYIYGNLAAEYMQLINDGDNWDVGIITWPWNGPESWEEINRITSNTPAGGGFGDYP